MTMMMMMMPEIFRGCMVSYSSMLWNSLPDNHAFMLLRIRSFKHFLKTFLFYLFFKYLFHLLLFFSGIYVQMHYDLQIHILLLVTT